MKPQTTTPGRPRLDSSDTSIPVSYRVTTRQYDRMTIEAKRARLPLADWIRQQTNANSQRSE